jgi:hypothetical protein
MKKLLPVILVVFLVLSINGCLVPEKISYTIRMVTPKSGNVTMQFYNIKSNASTDEEFNEDKENLFNYITKSDKLISQLKGEGKDIVSRDLFLEDGKLNGKAEYRFNNIEKVEGIRFEDGFYYLTLALDDSVISTNGQIIKSRDYKRILWDKSIKVLKFEMYSSGFNDNEFKALAPYYNTKN